MNELQMPFLMPGCPGLLRSTPRLAGGGYLQKKRIKAMLRRRSPVLIGYHQETFDRTAFWHSVMVLDLIHGDPS